MSVRWEPHAQLVESVKPVYVRGRVRAGGCAGGRAARQVGVRVCMFARTRHPGSSGDRAAGRSRPLARPKPVGNDPMPPGLCRRSAPLRLRAWRQQRHLCCRYS